MNTGYDVTNPYLNTYTLGVRGSRRISASFDLLVGGFVFLVRPSEYNATLERDLRVFGVEAARDTPKELALLEASYHLMAGRVNLFGICGTAVSLRCPRGAPGPS